MKHKRLCVHLHFAPPEAEKTWIGEPEEDPSSWPFHDPWELCFHRWVEPHLRGSRTDEDGRILEPASSFDTAGFSFSPDLLGWIESHRPSAYRLILDADARSLSSSGHGAALAAPFASGARPRFENRGPLAAGPPDCPPSGRIAALASCLEDFQLRFGRKAEGAWLGDAAAPFASGERPRSKVRGPLAADPVLLDAAAGLGLRFVLLSAAIGSEEGGGHLPLLWEDGSRGLAVFFPDPGLSGAVEKLALRLASRLHAGNTAELVLLAERAERFSENGRQGSRILIAAFSEIARQETFKPASPAVFLDLFPPPRKLERPP